MSDGHLSLTDYQRQAERTMRLGERPPRYLKTNFALGLAGETGELVDLLKKHLFHGHPLDKEKARNELGDVLWYVTALCSVLEVELVDVAMANIAKLRARYPDGFSPEKSINRSE